jgi:hypothetical protein
MESIKEEERNTETEMMSLRREGEKTLENERRMFRAGYEDRLQKVYDDFINLRFLMSLFLSVPFKQTTGL